MLAVNRHCFDHTLDCLRPIVHLPEGLAFQYLAEPKTKNVGINQKIFCFSRLLKCLRSLYANSVDPDQTASIGAV